MFDDKKYVILRSDSSTNRPKHFSGEIIGIYKLLRTLGDGPKADPHYWIAECMVCGAERTLNMHGITALKKTKWCSNCKDKVKSECSRSLNSNVNKSCY
jgi:hypothetical protein